MPLADLPDLTDEERGLLSDPLNPFAIASALTVQTPDITADLRWTSRLMVRVRSYGQDVSACGIGVTEDAGADAFVAASVTETRTKGSLSYAVVHTQPTATRLLLAEGGDCETGSTEDPGPPSGWDSEPGDVVLETTYGGVITGADLAAAAVAGEVLINDSDWGTLKAYARRWWEVNTLDIPTSYASKRWRVGVRRVKVELEVVGFRVPVNVRWESRLTNLKTGDVADPVDQLWEAGPGAWTFTIDDGYPAYPYVQELLNWRLEPVV